MEFEVTPEEQELVDSVSAVLASECPTALVRDVIKTRFEGGAYAKMSRAHGYADGYMAALMDSGTIERDQCLRVVGEERNRLAHAPATAH